MNAEPSQLSLDAIPNARSLVEDWSGSLAEALEAMAGQKPEIHWESVPATEVGPALGDEPLWWEQPVSAASGASIWVGAAKDAWERAGTLTLKAAGIDAADTAEVRKTWLEILGQSLAAVTRALGSILGHEVTSGTGVEAAPGPEVVEWASAGITFPETPASRVLIGFNPPLISVISDPLAVAGGLDANDSAPDLDEAPPSGAVAVPRTLDLLMDVELPVSISFGKAHLPMKDVLKLTTGSIVELDRAINEPVDVLVNHCLIARGEVVVVEGNYGIRIQQIASRNDRLRSLP